MKCPSKRLPLILTLLCAFTLLSCEKKLFDKRNKYCGEWNFEINRSCTVGGSPSKDTTYQYKGEVFYQKSEDDKIIIDFSSDDQVTFKIDQSGNISNDINYGINGKFQSKKKLSISYYSGGLGGGCNYSITGTKD